VEVNFTSTLATAGEGRLTARVDNAYQFYVNGSQVLSANNWSGVETLLLTLHPGDQIAVHAWDTGGQAGAFFDIELPDGRHIGSGSDWLLSTTAPGNWTAKDYDASSWVAATEFGGPNNSPWANNGTLPDTSPGQWIWSADNWNTNEVFLRFVIPDFLDV